MPEPDVEISVLCAALRALAGTNKRYVTAEEIRAELPDADDDVLKRLSEPTEWPFLPLFRIDGDGASPTLYTPNLEMAARLISDE